MKKALSALLLLALAEGLLLGVNTNNYASAQGPTEVKRVISQDTTWQHKAALPFHWSRRYRRRRNINH